MEDKTRRLYEMLLRVSSFMSANAADFQEAPFVTPTITALQAETDVLTALGAAKLAVTAAAKDSTTTRSEARRELRSDLEYVAAVWRSMPDETKGLENKFRLPRGDNDQNLVAAGKSFADEAAKPDVAALLTAHALPPEFFTALREKAVLFEQKINAAESARGERVGTNAAFHTPARNGRKLVDKLTPTVKYKYRDNPQKLAAWLTASRVERSPKRAKREKATTGTNNQTNGTGAM